LLSLCRCWLIDDPHRLKAPRAHIVSVKLNVIFSFMENGEYNPSLLLAVKITRVFGASVEEVFHFDEDELELDP